ncbi:cupin domain-containing protein [Rhizobium sp. CNPSo 3490]|uniref:cupin domain-containing protein n=1 Tax=Rhizobium sp. CNPSo 3490 TaxID=3021407 RepID=UPI00254B0112|nr:cupin domain-containing protein [Rhizobium sp. CNPSo 3490]MDK4734447.1 cupin domain-containing protein [Rhizobium sp. CNPSo 3490]
MSFPAIHRVVTGHDADGKSIVAIDGPLPTVVELNAIPGMIFHEVWETRGTPAQVDNSADPTTGALMHQPPKHGTRIRFVDMPPDAEYLADGTLQMKELFNEVNDPSGLTVKADSPHPMMHRSEAVDYGIVIDGEMTLMLDDSEVPLKPYSVVIQRGTNHAWANRSGKLCRMLFIQIDGQYEPSIAAALARR